MGLFDRLRRGKSRKLESDEGVSPPAATGPPEWIESELWREWDPPLDIVAGESHYQQALQRVAGRPRHGGWLVACEAELRREPENRYDGDAIAVYIGGSKVGYIKADACGELAAALDRYGANARASGVPALVRGGWSERPSLGVMLWLNHEEVRRSLPEVEWDELIEDFECQKWPPHDGEGTDLRSEVPTRTGTERHQRTAQRFGGEPRMPPLTEHYTDYVENVKELKRRKDHERAATLLLSLIEAAEEESRAEGWGVPPWYYEQLAIVRRKQGDLDGEIEVLERYAAMSPAPGAAREQLLARLEKAKARAAKRVDERQ